MYTYAACMSPQLSRVWAPGPPGGRNGSPATDRRPRRLGDSLQSSAGLAAKLQYGLGQPLPTYPKPCLIVYRAPHIYFFSKQECTDVGYDLGCSVSDLDELRNPAWERRQLETLTPSEVVISEASAGSERILILRTRDDRIIDRILHVDMHG